MRISRPDYSAHRNTRHQNFVCNAPQAQKVSLVGDFNKWDPTMNPLKKGADEVWALQMELRHGHHRYAFLADGHLVLDPLAMGVTRDDKGQRVSLIAVS
jgi:1,4-alpha-glucan branching enzyme